MRVITLIFTVFSAVILFTCEGLESKRNPDIYLPNGFNHYDISCQILPGTQFLQAKVVYSFKAPYNNFDRAKFYLNKQLEITSVNGANIAGYRYDVHKKSDIMYMPNAGYIYFAFDKPYQKGDTVIIEIEYEGKLTKWESWSANLVTPEWVELGIYLTWFPVNLDYGKFTFYVSVETEPRYNVVSYGTYSKVDEVWSFSWTEPTNDIVLALSKDIKTQKMADKNNTVQIHYVDLEDTTAAYIADDLMFILEHYSEWFGGNKRRETAILQSPRSSGGGYSRDGLIVLGNLEDQDYFESQPSLIRYLAHETAHLYWNSADVNSWEDWLNESFSEFSALLVVREYFGEEEFLQYIYKKQSESKDTPALWGLNRTDRSTDENADMIEKVLYSKGPVILFDLFNKLGEDKFLELMNNIYTNNINTTENLIKFISFSDNDIAEWLEKELKSE